LRLALGVAASVQIAALPGAIRTATAQTPPPRTFDVVVYGGTAGGVMAAVSAARMGLDVALVEPSRHLGGMVTGGLSATDHGEKIVTGGYALEFYRRIGKRYGLPLFWYPEPSVAEAVLRDMLGEEKKVRLFLNQRLREHGGVRKNGSAVEELALESGARVKARIFIESSYEGDVMKQAGVSYTVGREPSSQYGESLAGVRPRDRNHQFDLAVPSRDESGKLLPEISPLPRGEIGSGDKRVQAYNFRLILTTAKANQVRFEKPPGYTPRRYEVLRRFIDAVQRQRGTPPTLDELLLIRADLPNAKADFNNRGPFSTDYIGASYGYPDGTYAERLALWREHVRYTKGLLYFLANDPGVPASIRSAMNAWGLAKDEFTDNGNWPYQLYVREGRRMVGDFVMTQKDVQTDLTKPDVIAMGSYNSDSHNVQRFVQPDGSVQNEGNMEVPVQPYQIPYRVMLPRKSETRNLLVAVPFSASHVVYSSMRMEPQYMMIGQAAGVAAALALRHNVGVHDIDTAELRRILKAQGMIDVYDPATAPEAPQPPRSLFNGKDLSGWHVDVPARDSSARVRNPFIVRNGMLVSLGEPQGHLITDSSYRNYRLEVQYRFSAKPGNAGVLVHASTPRALYAMFPRSIEVQMESGNAGDFWCIVEDIRVPDMERRRGPRAQWGTTAGKARRILNLTDNSEKPVGQWNTMVIEAVGRSLRVWVNGDLVNDGTDATADHGQIALQAEGSEVEFRKLSLTPITRLTPTR
jgi:hypothetical protein